MHNHAAGPQSILIVEDSEDDYEATMRAFKNVHLINPLCWCRSGRDALDFLRHDGKYKEPGAAERPGLILLDLNMPGIDGRKTLQLIKGDDELSNIPVIILTTSGDERDVAACYQVGANTYIQKPVTFTELVEAMKRLKEYWFEIALLPNTLQQEEGGPPTMMDKHATVMSDPVRNNESFRILVVDDSPDDRELYLRLLKKRSDINFEIYETDNVEDGLNIGHERNPDCILVDYQLPGDSGIKFIQSYKENNVNSATAIIMVTGQGNETTAVEAMKLGALDYVQKSQIPEDFFVQNILNTIERARLKKSIVRYQHNLERSNKALLEFAHTAAHDLKGPVRHIASYCELLKDNMGEQVGPDGLAYIDRMMINANRLQKLIDHLLDYSRAMHSKEEKEKIDLEKIIHDLPDDLETMIMDNNAVILTDKLPVISAYPLRINQLFQNLISNAIKYRGQEDPVIAIKCSDKGTFYQFSVHDNGIGIAENYQEMIFKPFQRLHTQEKIEGSGLGLAICKKAVSMHNGKIWVESEPGKGSTFYFTIPKP